ncbi:ATP-binding protein [Acidobacterium sp. S8]|uniref:PAS domain-containing sensor histidine kinase n=1 Tax=Acidobacterium sp. S8 TaxID=1641854 RepID=UPI0020B13EC1|nr:ATP-binding protein [Acidobacterium sp. S8]
MLNNPLNVDQKDDALLRSQMAQFFDATTDAIIFLDRSYNFTFLNRQARELISPDGKVLGKNLFESFPATVYENSPYIENYRKSMEDGLATEFEAFYPESLNLWLRIQSYPAKDGITIFFRDITQERMVQIALLEKSAQAERQISEIETLYRTAPIGLALFDVKDFRYLRLNDRQAQFFGLAPEQVVGRTLTEMAPIEGLRELFEQVRSGEPVINYPLEGTLVTDPEQYRYWTVSYFPVYAADGSVQAITAASLEITQQKKAEQALVQNEKLVAVGRLASSIAHEINNPLESVTNLLYLARHSNNLAKIQEYLDTAERELRRVSVISNQTLRFHKQSTSPQEVSSESLIDSVTSIYQGRIVNAHVQVETRLRAEKTVRCFEGEIRQIISNLVSNAIDAMAPSGGGRLLLRSRAGTDWKSGKKGMTFTVADSGTGMTRQTLTKLFEPFFTTKGFGGTGLGLWVTKEIIDRHQGKLRVRSSQAKGKSGTVFTIFLPFSAAIQRNKDELA